MTTLRRLFKRLPLSLLIVLCLTLGLAPFVPEPHLLEKLRMLVSGELGNAIEQLLALLVVVCTAVDQAELQAGMVVQGNAIDLFDLLLHGTPWLLLIVKLWLQFSARTEQ